MLPKLETAKAREAREQRVKVIFSLFIILVLGLSIVGVALFYFGNEQEGTVTYNGYHFEQKENGWQTSVKAPEGKYFLLATYLPEDVENVNYSGGILNSKDFESIVYFVAKSNAEKKAAEEINHILLAGKKEMACLPQDINDEACKNMTIKSCENANYIQKIIVFEEINESNYNESSESASIEYKNNCVTIKGSASNMIRAADKAIYMMFGIIKQK